MIQVPITSEYITLSAFLKLSGAVESGGQAKMCIMDGFVRVNDRTCLQKGKKLYGGEKVSLGGQDYEVVKTCI